MNTQIFLIGGTPGSGKTTLGTALANKLGFRSLTIDDLVTGATAITTPETHPGIHAMRRLPHLEYYTNSSLEQLKTDTNLRHEATLPMVECLIRKYQTQGLGIVIDGWHIRPQWVATLDFDRLWAGWIVIDETVLEEREKQNWDFFGKSPDPDKMFNTFMGRSLWYNNFVREEAKALNMPILYQTGDLSVDNLCQQILDYVG